MANYRSQAKVKINIKMTPGGGGQLFCLFSSDHDADEHDNRSRINNSVGCNY